VQRPFKRKAKAVLLRTTHRLINTGDIVLEHHDALKDAKNSPLWHDPEIMPEVLPALKSDETCELLIVGGGFTGLWAALQAKERKPDADVILIEQTFVADGASGRCGGMIHASLSHGESNTAARFASESDRLDTLGEQNLDELLATLERYNIDARYEKTGHMSVALDEESALRMRSDFDEAKAHGADVVWFDRDEIRKEVDSPTFHAGLWFRDGEDGVVDPARLCFGLKDVLLKLGVRIFEGTRLVDLEEDGKTGMKAICEGGEIQSRKVLLATNAFTSKIGRMRRTVIPVWDYQIATEPLSEAQCEAIGWHKSRHALSDYAKMFHYFRMTKDNRITYGGGGLVRYYFNRGTDRKLSDVPALYDQLAEEFFRTFPQLRDMGVKFSNKWGGIIATSTRFCMVPGTAYDGRVAWSIGYTGLGVGASRFGARIAIEMLGYEPTDILKMDFVTRRPLPWAPEPFRWIGVRLTQLALLKADRNGGKRGLWLRTLDKFGLGFTC
jgi:glycine/D-amino acid oxidase-like deaminating enzyme